MIWFLAAVLVGGGFLVYIPSQELQVSHQASTRGQRHGERQGQPR